MTVLLVATMVCLAACCEQNNDATMNNIDQTCVEKTVKALREK